MPHMRPPAPIAALRAALVRSTGLSVPTNPGAAIVWAAGHRGLSGSLSPLVPENG
jgi:hypothetical protein